MLDTQRRKCTPPTACATHPVWQAASPAAAAVTLTLALALTLALSLTLALTLTLTLTRRRLLLQLHSLDASISGGLVGYVRRAAALLKDSQEGKNPLEGFTPSVPAGHGLQLGSPDFLAYEVRGKW